MGAIVRKPSRPALARRKGRRGLGQREKITGYPKQGHTTMDAEHINQSGNQIEDLSSRTEELRGYL